MRKVRLGFNIDHVATLRNARGETLPSVMRAAKAVIDGGADHVTMHLREDRRHIRDQDLVDVQNAAVAKINLEMAATPEMAKIAKSLRPKSVLLVPENRQEITTEGGLCIRAQKSMLIDYIADLRQEGLVVNLFIDPDLEQVEAAHDVGAYAIELHTGPFTRSAKGDARKSSLAQYRKASVHGRDLGLEIHAGHGLDYGSAREILAINEIEELNIGHFLVGESLFEGLETVTRKMVRSIAQARELS